MKNTPQAKCRENQFLIDSFKRQYDNTVDSHHVTGGAQKFALSLSNVCFDGFGAFVIFFFILLLPFSSSFSSPFVSGSVVVVHGSFPI